MTIIIHSELETTILVEQQQQQQQENNVEATTITTISEVFDENSHHRSSSEFVSHLAKHFLTGYFGGICQAVASHPFDVVKSRIQSGHFSNSRDTVRHILAKEGASAFYKGVGPPIAVSGIYNAVLIVCNEAAKDFLVEHHKILRLPDPDSCGGDANCDSIARRQLPMTYVVLASIMTAPAACAILSPTDVIKIQLQLQRESKEKAKYSGTIDCAVKMVRDGGFRSLTRGYWPTLATRVIGLPAYFIGFDLGKKWWRQYFPNSSDFVTALAGGSVAGIAFWCSILHLDTIKTRMQAQQVAIENNLHHNFFYTNASQHLQSHGHKRAPMKPIILNACQIARDIYMKQGIRGFWTGFGVCMVRAIPANASVFAGIDLSEKWLKKHANW